VELPVNVDRMRWRQPCRLHGVGNLMLDGRRFLLFPQRQRAAENAYKISHLKAP
jgi:hypothetical protein